jgi:putative AlgH/UPF0301 family transcriptional regulator
MAPTTKRGGGEKRGFLDGQMLIAMPAMRDERFARSLIYMCAHSSEGAMGIVVNHAASNIKFPDLLVQLDVIPAKDLIQLPRKAGTVKVLKGGPVETGRGFVLHSNDFFIENSTLPIDNGICLTATLDILKAIAHGEGPRTAGSTARPTRSWSSAPTSTRNTRKRCASSASISASCRATRATRRACYLASTCRGTSAWLWPTSPIACSGSIGSANTKPCAYSQPSW